MYFVLTIRYFYLVLQVNEMLKAAGKELALLFQPADFMKELHADSLSRNSDIQPYSEAE